MESVWGVSHRDDLNEHGYWCLSTDLKYAAVHFDNSKRKKKANAVWIGDGDIFYFIVNILQQNKESILFLNKAFFCNKDQLNMTKPEEAVNTENEIQSSQPYFACPEKAIELRQDVSLLIKNKDEATTLINPCSFQPC